MNKVSLSRRFVFLFGFLLSVIFSINAQRDAQRPLYTLPDAATPVLSSSSIALSDDGRTLIVANMLNDTVSIVDPFAGEVLAEIAVGDDPRFVALTEDNSYVLTVNRGDGTLSIIDLEALEVVDTHNLGLLPYGIVTDNDDTAYVTLQASDKVIEIDLSTGRIVSWVAVPSQPAGLTLWGDFLYVTHLWTGQLSLVYLPEMEVVRTIHTGVGASQIHSLTIDPQSGRAYVPQSRSNDDYHVLTYDSIVEPYVGVVNLATMKLEKRIALEIVDRPVNMPFAARLVRGRLYVVNAGSGDVSVIDIESGLATAHLDVGANPRGLVPSRDNTLIFIHNAIDGSITTLNTRSEQRTDLLPISDLNIPIDTFIGAQLFHSAEDSRLSRDSWVSCASCHFDGQSDGRVWQSRNTPVLYYLQETAPYTWTSDWDEIADIEYKVRFLQAGDGLIEGDLSPLRGPPHSGRSLDLDTLSAYISTFSVAKPSTDILPEQIQEGRELFRALECMTCHADPLGTDGQSYDVGIEGEINTPPLIALWQSAPYLHDGRAVTLLDIFTLPGIHQLVDTHTLDEINNLIAYLRSR